MINELKDLVKKVDIMYKDIENFSKEMEITERSEMEVLDMKISVIFKNNSFNGFISRRETEE